MWTAELRTGMAALALIVSVPFALAEPSAIDSPGAPRTVEAQLAALSIEEKAGQVLLTSIVGRSVPSAESRKILAATHGAGVILFRHNLGDPAEIARFIDTLQAGARGRSGIPRLIAIDHEGGRVQRLRKGFTRLPPPRELGRLDVDALETLGIAVARQLRAVGVNMNLAPVVEVSGRDDNVVGDRAFGRTAESATRGATAFLRGLQSGGVAATAKHFPGNAGSGVDPHDDMPRLDHDRVRVGEQLLPPFVAAIAAGTGSIMLSHVEIPALDPGAPVTLSRTVINGVLRGELGFRGVVLTDDLLMRALRSRYTPTEAALRALEAGADLLMVSDEAVLPTVHAAIVGAVRSGRLPAARLDDAAGRVLAMKARFRMDEPVPDTGVRLQELEAADRLATRVLSALGEG